MTALRPVLVLIVLVVVLFAISLTLSSRNRDQPVDPATSWFNKFNLSQPVAATNISVSNGTLKNGQWLLPATLGEASLDLAPTQSTWRVRSLKITLQQGGPLQITFTPRPDQHEPKNPADAQATPLTIKNLQTGQSVQLTILQHGGTLAVHRTGGGNNPTILKLE
jgi:hypothetical protein